MIKLSDCLGMEEPALDGLVAVAERQYHVYPIRKASGRKRWIEAPAPILKMAQRRLLVNLLYQLAPTGAAHGFVPGRSILTHAEAHCHKAWVVTADIENFFPSVSDAMLAGVVKELPLSPADQERCVRLVTRANHLPQGAPTSPHLGNLVLRNMDEQLIQLAADAGWAYSRYADDLALSGPAQPREMLAAVKNAVGKHGFRVVDRKCRVMGRHQRQYVTGLTVNEGLRLPREIRRRLRAIGHTISTWGWGGVHPQDEWSVAGWQGYADYVARFVKKDEKTVVRTGQVAIHCNVTGT